MWGECILYMPATDSAKRMSDEYFYHQGLYEERVALERENEKLRMEIAKLKGEDI